MVSCIMATANRPHLLGAAVRIFLQQDYNNAELVILDDGQYELYSSVMAGYSKSSRVRYACEPPGRSLGEKHNRLVELARGDILVHWADDDWYAPWRLSYQVGLMEQMGWDMCSTSEILWIEAAKKKAWHFRPGETYFSGASLAYRRKLWERCPYEDVATGEDAGFIRNQLLHGGSLGLKLDYRMCVQRIHATNVASNKQMHDQWLVPFEEVKAVVGRDWDTYFGGEDSLSR